MKEKEEFSGVYGINKKGASEVYYPIIRVCPVSNTALLTHLLLFYRFTNVYLYFVSEQS